MAAVAARQQEFVAPRHRLFQLHISALLQGAIGLEGLSRGCAQAHFVEMSPWVVKRCLGPNIQAANFGSQSVVHQMKAEDFLRRSFKGMSFAGGPFDFISVTPPYMLVSYPELYDLLDKSCLLHERSVLIVEYAKQNIPDIRQHVGKLSLLKSRRYGRTYLAVYCSAL
jgi:16S rRNA G966 N2-methylase RsmD